MTSTTAPRFDPAGFSLRPLARRVDKPWGYEILLTPDGLPYCAKLIHVWAGKRLSLQIHDTKAETQTLLSGRGVLLLEGPDGELHAIPLEPGVGYHVAPGQRHRICADRDEDVTVFEASTPEEGTTYRLEDDFARTDETDELRRRERAAASAD